MCKLLASHASLRKLRQTAGQNLIVGREVSISQASSTTQVHKAKARIPTFWGDLEALLNPLVRALCGALCGPCAVYFGSHSTLGPNPGLPLPTLN